MSSTAVVQIINYFQLLTKLSSSIFLSYKDDIHMYLGESRNNFTFTHEYAQ